MSTDVSQVRSMRASCANSAVSHKALGCFSLAWHSWGPVFQASWPSSSSLSVSSPRAGITRSILGRNANALRLEHWSPSCSPSNVPGDRKQLNCLGLCSPQGETLVNSGSWRFAWHSPGHSGGSWQVDLSPSRKYWNPRCSSICCLQMT